MLDIVILAAGKGTRMKSDLPKVMHSIGGQSLLMHVISSAQQLLSVEQLDQQVLQQRSQQAYFHLIVGHGSEKVKAAFSESNINFIEQGQQLGTGHAVLQALPFIKCESIALILYGDVPLITTETLRKLISHVKEDTLGLLTVNLDDPSGYGRVVRNEGGAVTAIIEEKDASEKEKLIQEVNTGIMAVNVHQLKQWLPLLSKDNAQGEYYLTDIIAMAKAKNVTIVTEQPKKQWEVMGINNRQQQAELERIYQKNYADALMKDGVTLYDPQRFDCRGELACGTDVVIDINCVFEGHSHLGNHVVIGPNCIIKNTTIGDNTVIKANSIIEDSIIAKDCTIGPFARLRPGTKIDNKAKIGNFVETKKAVIGEGSKINHLSYVGDALLGKGVNVGAGAITCNYDGVNKHQTTIGDDVFIGSNTALVAPIIIDDGATVGAGSTINKKVEKDTLSLARSPQKNLKGWQRPEKKK